MINIERRLTYVDSKVKRQVIFQKKKNGTQEQPKPVKSDPYQAPQLLPRDQQWQIRREMPRMPNDGKKHREKTG